MGHWLKWRFLWMFIRKSAGMLMNGQCCASIFLSPTSSFISKDIFQSATATLSHLSAFIIFYHQRFQCGLPTEKISWAAQRLTWASISFFLYLNLSEMRVLNSSIMLSYRWRFQMAKFDFRFVDNAENGAHLFEMGRVQGAHCINFCSNEGWQGLCWCDPRFWGWCSLYLIFVFFSL